MTKYLYRKTIEAVTLATAIVALSFSSQAQFRIAPPERTTPRAIGVLETFKNGSQRLLPVTFYYEKKYYDATFYHATPVPFTLYSETVYEVEQFGKPLGTFTVLSATQQNAATWFGNGKFKTAPDPALMAKKRSVPKVVVEDSSKPVLHRRAGSEGDNPAPHPAAADATTAQADEDPDRPKLHRREGSSDAPAPPPTQASAQAPAPSPDASQTEESSGQDPDRPKLHRKDDSSSDKTASTAPPATTSTAPPATSSNQGVTGAIKTASAKSPELTPTDDPDHPVLRRGKPVQVQGGRDLPDFQLEQPVARQVAVSDAGPSEMQPLVYVCRQEEREKLESQARELAQSELQRLASQRGLSAPTAAKSTTAARKFAATKSASTSEMKPAEEQFVPYDLDYSNYATVVFSARYKGTPGADGKPRSWVVTVIGRADDGKLIKLYSAVSDPRELDLYPEVRLVDAVDPDGYGRAALLFREQKRDGVSWLLGRVNGYELQTVFETTSR